ncbi:MAG: hypothetical protein R2784_12105 [Saprospiraceae bacterium]
MFRTVTDFDGKYSVEVPAGLDQLEFSYAGYSSQTITLDASNVVNVKMAAGALLGRGSCSRIWYSEKSLTLPEL